jgi:hypothetical protein
VAGADWHHRGGEQTEVEEEAFLLRLFSRRVTVGWTGLWWRWARVGLHLVGYFGQVSPGEPPPIFFCFLFLSYFLFLNSVLIQI